MQGARWPWHDQQGTKMEALEALLGKATSPAIPGLEAEVLEPQEEKV